MRNRTLMAGLAHKDKRVSRDLPQLLGTEVGEGNIDRIDNVALDELIFAPDIHDPGAIAIDTGDGLLRRNLIITERIPSNKGAERGGNPHKQANQQDVMGDEFNQLFHRKSVSQNFVNP